LTSETNKSEMYVEFSLDHIAISVSNLDVSIDFYTELFGFTCERIIEMPNKAGRIALLKKPDFTIEMFQFTDVLPFPNDINMPLNDLKVIGVKHFALRVKDIWDAATFLKKHGVEFVNDPVIGARGFNRFFVKDPDGIPLELTEGPGSV